MTGTPYLDFAAFEQRLFDYLLYVKGLKSDEENF